jgi:hypothetical protein
MESAGEAASGSRLSDYGSDYTRVNRTIEWGTVSNKNGAAVCRGTSFLKIRGDGIPGGGRQGQDVGASGLACADGQCGVPPVDVFKAQRGHLEGAQPEVHHAANDRVIALTLWTRLLKGRRESAELLLVQVLRQRIEPPARRLRHRRHKRLHRICIPQGAKPEITPNGGCHHLRAARLIALALSGEEVTHGFRPQPREIKTAEGKAVSKEPTNPLAS